MKTNGRVLEGKEKKELIKKIKSYKEEDIVFHDDFGKGERIALCVRCGYAQNFVGLWDYNCDNCGGKMKIYSDNKFQDFIFKIQNIAVRREKEMNGLIQEGRLWKLHKKKRM